MPNYTPSTEASEALTAALGQGKWHLAIHEIDGGAIAVAILTTIEPTPQTFQQFFPPGLTDEALAAAWLGFAEKVAAEAKPVEEFPPEEPTEPTEPPTEPPSEPEAATPTETPTEPTEPPSEPTEPPAEPPTEPPA